MKNEPIIIERTYDAPISRVWKALTDRDEMEKWYFKLDKFRPEIGFRFQFAGQGAKGEKYTHLCEIKEVVPHTKLAYSWRYDGFTGDSLLTFELFDEGDKTRLRLTHAGIESFPAGNPDFGKESFKAGWEYITGISLKEFVEK